MDCQKKPPSIAIASVPPLASIDETEVDLSGTSPRGDGSFIPSSCNKNLVILTNNVPQPPPSELPLLRSSLFSPESDDFGGLTTLTMATSSGPLTVDDELGDTGFFSSSLSCSSKRSSIDSTSLQHQLQLGHFTPYRGEDGNDDDEDEDQLMDDFLDGPVSMPKSHSRFTVASTPGEESTTMALANQSPDLSNSLEDLVNCFDEKVKSCLKNMEENVSSLAPVQMRSPEEFIRERPAWWTLTGNYGSILPIDWSKLAEPETGESGPAAANVAEHPELYDETAADDVTLKHLIDVCLELDSAAPIKSADEVLEEIDAIMSGRIAHSLLPASVGANDLQSLSSEHSLDLSDVPVVRRMSFYRFSLEKLKQLSLDQLQDLNEDLECKVQKHSECLVKQLAHRDELEFEKEQKNSFISLMLSLQNRRKQFFQEQQKGGGRAPVGRKLRYLTTVIPYNRGQAADNVPVLQVLIKILKAMLEDSPTVPTLLTDYILTHICPSESYRSSAAAAAEQRSTYVKSALRSLARGHSVTTSANFSQLTASLNSKLQAARRSFSFTGGKNGSVSDHCNNNNPEGPIPSRKSSISATSATFDSCNAIVA